MARVEIPDGAHILVAQAAGKVVATVSLLLEGDTARLVRLASAARSAGILTGLFDLAARHGRRLSAAAWLEIDVNPRHVGFCRAAFGFKALGEVCQSAEVRAPGQRMRIAVDQAVDRLAGVQRRARSA